MLGIDRHLYTGERLASSRGLKLESDAKQKYSPIQKFGFHNVYEAYLYQALYGLFVCPWYAYSQTGISEAAPKGYEFQFFSLLNLVGRTSCEES